MRSTPVLCARPGCFIRGRHLEACDGQCTGCLPARAAAGLRLCGYCASNLGRDALLLAGLYADLGEVLVGAGPSGLGDYVTTSADPNLKLNAAAVAERTRIRAALVGLVREVATERGVSLPVDEVADLCRFVERHAEWLAAQPTAGDRAETVRDLAHGRAYGIAYPSGTRRFLLTYPDGSYVECPRRTVPDESGRSRPCPGALWTVLRRADSLLPSAILCNADPDSHTWEPRRWLAMGEQLLARRAAAVADAERAVLEQEGQVAA